MQSNAIYIFFSLLMIIVTGAHAAPIRVEGSVESAHAWYKPESVRCTGGPCGGYNNISFPTVNSGPAAELYFNWAMPDGSSSVAGPVVFPDGVTGSQAWQIKTTHMYYYDLTPGEIVEGKKGQSHELKALIQAAASTPAAPNEFELNFPIRRFVDGSEVRALLTFRRATTSTPVLSMNDVSVTGNVGNLITGEATGRISGALIGRISARATSPQGVMVELGEPLEVNANLDGNLYIPFSISSAVPGKQTIPVTVDVTFS